MWWFLFILLVALGLIVAFIAALLSAGNKRRELLAAARGPAIPARTRGRFSVQAVGESNYQDALESACGGRSEESASHKCTAYLIPENANKYDDQAVRVDVEDGTAGYLSRADARKYRARYGENVTSCPAEIVGGWERDDGNRGHFGIRLDLDMRTQDFEN